LVTIGPYKICLPFLVPIAQTRVVLLRNHLEHVSAPSEGQVSSVDRDVQSLFPHVVSAASIGNSSCVAANTAKRI
jgi:hypothetical protein